MATKDKDILNTYVEPTDNKKEDGEEKSKDYSDHDFTTLLKQTDSEWTQGWHFLKPKWEEWGNRLRLFNNQKRDKDSVGDTTLFAIFMTILSALYKDRLSASFSPREIGDDEIAENLELTADYDYDLMNKAMVDYEWDWEACFFGRSLL